MRSKSPEGHRAKNPFEGLMMATALAFLPMGAYAEQFESDSYGRVIAHVLVNGEQRPFVMDTAAYTIITEDFARELRLEALGAVPVTGGGGTARFDETRIERMTVDGNEFSNVRTLIAPGETLQNALRSREVVGLIGINVLEGRRLVIDLENNAYHLEEGDSEMENAVVLPSARAINRSPIVPMEVETRSGRLTINVMIDTGLGGIGVVVANDAFFAATRISAQTSESDVSALGSTNTPHESQQATIPSLTVGDVTLENVFVRTAALPMFERTNEAGERISTPGILIGLPTLREIARHLEANKIIIDFTNAGEPRVSFVRAAPLAAGVP